MQLTAVEAEGLWTKIKNGKKKTKPEVVFHLLIVDELTFCWPEDTKVVFFFSFY